MSTPPLERPAEQRLGLRERKKLKTRRSIQEHGLRLFREQGYEATTVDQIADAAEVSPSTFFRYYPTKEDVVVSDEYDPLIEAELRELPPDIPPAEALRRTVIVMVAQMVDADRTRMFERIRLMMSVPALRSRYGDNMGDAQKLMCKVLAERTGRDPADFELRAFSGAVLGVWEAAILTWVDADGDIDLVDLLNQGMDFLTAGCPM